MTTTRERQLKEFEEWVTAEGLIKPNGLTIAKTEEGGYGLVFESTEKLKEFQQENKSLLELSVPFKLIFCTILHPERSQPLRDKILSRYPDFFAHDKEQGKHLAAENDSDLLLDSEQIASYMFLIQENRDPNSYWRRYFDLLPKTFTSSLHWSEEELALIKGSNLYVLTAHTRKLVEYIYLNMKEVDPLVTQEDILWAHSLYSSRAFGVRTGQVLVQNTNLQFYYRDEDPPSVSSLVPFCDFFNHDFNTRAYYSAEKESGQFNFQILYEPEKTGLQVMNNYGKKSNEHLIVNYGFFVDGNPNNTFWLKIGVSKKDPMVDNKFLLLRKKRLSGKYVIKKGEIPEKLMEAARLYLMTPEQYYFYNKKHYERAETPMHSPREPLLPAVDDIATDHMNEHRVFSKATNKEFKFITVENELQMYTYVIHQFQTHLSKLKALEAVPVPANGHPYHIKMALGYRAEQIDIVESTLQSIQDMRKEFIQIIGDQPYYYPFESAFLAASVKHDADDWNAAFKPTNEGEIVSLPFDSLICRATISKTRIGKDILSQWPAIPDDKLICLFLIRVRFDEPTASNEDVRQWDSFFNLLRNVEYHTAINFNEQEVESLEGTPAHAQIASLRDELLEESQSYHETFDRWIWAQSTLRLFGEQAQLNPENAEESTLVLFPTVSQLQPNAAHPVKITVDFATQRIAVEATVPGMASSNYGGLDNTWLLIQFGLVFDDNIQDELEFELTIAPDHDLREEKLQLLNRFKLGLSHRLNRCTMSLQLLAAIKICAMSREEVTSWLNKTQGYNDKTLIEYDDMFVSSENERLALGALQFMLNRMLESFETSVEDDLASLNRSELSVRERLILRYKMSQKKIVKANIRIADNLVAQL